MTKATSFLSVTGILYVLLPLFAHGTETFEAFTEPCQVVKASSSDTGKIAAVCVKRGDRVKKGDTLMVLDSRVLRATLQTARKKAKSNARMRALQVECEHRRKRLEQLQSLRDDGVGNPEELRRAQADVEVAQLNIEAAKEDQELNHFQVAEIEARIEQRRIRSPIDGVITAIVKEAGEHVSAVDPHVLTVVQLKQLRATFYLPTDRVLTIAKSKSVQLEIAGGNATSAKVEYVAPVTEADSGRVRVDVLIDNAAGACRSGVLCRLTVATNGN